ncbi:hypothetical protein HRI_000842200 [Hibiscus trionum]|uniref:Reverse transcriptase n=1 Tax=Hibiscus trionum TaxID=183268 RepID=A0A9W7H653_HIBTR|nr:hypothetical protein HRI_000842200 [Hibiscus trionum]
MVAFRDTLSECDLGDLEFNEAWFTWERGKLPHTNIRERLDRAVANQEWWSMHPSYCVTHLVHSISDHCPLLIDTVGHTIALRRTSRDKFRFDANWVLEEEVDDLIKSAWGDLDHVLEKLNNVGCRLLKWSRENKKNRAASQKELLCRLHELVCSDMEDDKLQELIEVKLGLNLEVDKEELFLEQRARSNWLSHGDNNTSYFHKFASYRRRQTSIQGLFDAGGSWITSETEMLAMASSYFKELFATSSLADASSIFDKILPKVSHGVNESLKALRLMKCGMPFIFGLLVWHSLRNCSPLWLMKCGMLLNVWHL